MSRNTIGEVIRELRKRKHLTQEELAEGICSPVSISRIENGNQMPSSQVLDKILAKLGTSTYQICDIYYKSDKQLDFEEQADSVAEMIREGNIATANELLCELEKHVGDNLLNLQYYLLLSASVKIYEQQEAELIISILKKALAITKSQFFYDDFRSVLLTVREVNILSLLMIAYFRKDNILEAIALGEELIASMDKHENKLREYRILRINIGMNLAQFLEREHRYKEALLRCEEIEKLSIRMSEHILLPEILFMKAKELHFLGRDEECIHILTSTVPYMEIINKSEFAKVVRDFVRKELQIEL